MSAGLHPLPRPRQRRQDRFAHLQTCAMIGHAEVGLNDGRAVGWVGRRKLRNSTTPISLDSHTTEIKWQRQHEREKATPSKRFELASCCSAALKSKPPLPAASLCASAVRNHFRFRTFSSFQCPQNPTNHGFISLDNHPNPEISCFYQKGFSQITKETIGRATHALCVKRVVPLSVFLRNTLIMMYCKFGRAEKARYLFDQMPERNEASWNTMMSGYVRACLYDEALGLFRDMQSVEVYPSSLFIASLITTCDRSGCRLREGIQVHGYAVNAGLLRDVYVGTSLLHFYGTYDLISDAQMLFSEMPERNVVSWTSMMIGYLDNGYHLKVIDLYLQFLNELANGNANLYATVVSSCSQLKDESLGHQVVGHVIKHGLLGNVSAANSIISMFDCFRSPEDARYVFNCMDEHDTISWNALITANAHNGLWEESLGCFNKMRHVHKQINSITLSALLSAFNSVDNFRWGKGIHSLVVRLGLDSEVRIGNSLLDMYTHCGSTEDAEWVFGGMVERDVISWNSLISCYVVAGRSLDALKVLNEMLRRGKEVNYVTLTSILAACSNLEFLVEGKIVHALVYLSGLQHNLVTGNALITLYAKSQKMSEARKVFQGMSERNDVSWNAIIGGYAENEEPNEALKTFKWMRQEGIPANYITISNLLGACITPSDTLKHGMAIHAFIMLAGFESNKYVLNSLITMYAKCGDLGSSNFIFNGLDHKSSISWNAIIAANAHHGLWEEVLELIGKMSSAGLDLDQFTFSEGLAATAKLAMLKAGQLLHCSVVKLGLDSDPFVTNAAMDMYAKCGTLADVVRLVPHPVKRSRQSSNILISAFSRHGYFQKTKETFHEMIEMNLRPDRVTFISLLSACSHGGLVDEGLSYYASMTKEFHVQPSMEHCACIIDLLGRSGRLVEAEKFIEEMPFQPSDNIWRSLLAASRIHGNLYLGKKAVGHLFNLDPSDDSAYVLYSGVCATAGRWDDSEEVRREMGLHNVRKMAATSWVNL